VFEFEDEHDFGFTRYPFPGKAHVDYWEDDQVFGHFIKSVVAPDDRHAPSSPPSPKTKKWNWIASWILPYVGVFAVLLTAAFIMDKAVLMASGNDMASVLEIFRGTVGLATLLYGVTIGARIPRLTKSPFNWAMALLACIGSVVVCLATWGAFDSVAEDVVPISSTWGPVSSRSLHLRSSGPNMKGRHGRWLLPPQRSFTSGGSPRWCST
jgi:hypothetical protein